LVLIFPARTRRSVLDKQEPVERKTGNRAAIQAIE
jgi:hypothetical protein